MSTPQRRQPVGVIARLLAEPHRFGFFQAVRLLNRSMELTYVFNGVQCHYALGMCCARWWL